MHSPKDRCSSERQPWFNIKHLPLFLSRWKIYHMYHLDSQEIHQKKKKKREHLTLGRISKLETLADF